MRRKNLRILSTFLTASLILSSANTGVSTVAAEVDLNVTAEQEQSVTEDIVLQEEASEENITEMEEMVTEITVSEEEALSEDVTETETTSEEVTEAEQFVTKQDTVEESIEDLEEELVTEERKMEQVLAGPMSSIITDPVLYKAVFEIYKEKTGENLQESEFTYEKLSAYNGELDFSNFAQAASITSIEGLGSAKNAAAINISTLTGVTNIPSHEFEGCAFTSIELPASITTIGEAAFLECASLAEITLPDTLTVIGEQAFTKCTDLSAVHSTKQKNSLPSSLVTLGQQAFLNDIALTEISIPSFKDGSIIQNRPSLFAGCTGLAKVTIGAAITTIPSSAFENAGTESEKGLEIVFADGSKLDKISPSAFKGAKLTEIVDLSKCQSLTAIEDSAFETSKGMKKIVLPAKANGTLQLKAKVFAKTELAILYEEGSDDTEGVILPDYVNEIGAGCFYDNTVMTKVSLSPNLSIIPDYAFDGCTALSEVEQRQAGKECLVTVIGDCAFRSTAILDTDFMMNMNRLETIGYQKLEGLSQYGVGTTKNDEEKISSLPLGGGSIASDAENQKYDGNKYYGSEVFTNCAKLTKVTIPSTVKNIGGRAFYFASYDSSKPTSNIQEIVWETSASGQNAARVIYPEAFHGNMMMTTMILPNSSGETLSIGKYAFYGDKSLNKVGVVGKEKNVLPATVTLLDDGAFYLCESLENITIQNTEGGVCPDLGIKVFEKCHALTEATVPAKITVIPRHFFYDAPLSVFNVGDNSSIGITEIGTLAFMGHAFTEIDLSKYTSLEEIGAGAFAYYDNIIEPEESKRAAYIPSLLPQLETVILPKSLNGGNRLYVNSGAFAGQVFFDTVKVPGGVDDQIYIPDYIYENGQTGIFENTGVSKVVWQADETGINQWMNIPVGMFSGCRNITDVQNVLPTKDYIETIGKAAFAESGLKNADLSKYKSLKQLGSGTVTSFSGTPITGVFEACGYLTNVVLPETKEGVGLEIGEKTFYQLTNLKSAELGNAVSIQKQAFAECSSLSDITIPDTVAVIEQQVFEKCTGLKTVDFGSVIEIKDRAFSNCSSLVLTNSGLPDSLQKIGQYAFSETNSLGTVRFGSQLTEIGNYAFSKSGMTIVDFAKAEALAKLGTSAFSETSLIEFRLKNTQVTTVSQNVLYGCQRLATAQFGDEVLYIDQNALAGCPNLNYLEFGSTTTVSNRVFYNSYGSGTDKVYTAKGGSITIHVLTPEKTVVPVGRSIELPYYINEAGFSKFDHILVGDGSSDESVKEYLNVSANLLDGYYWGRLATDNDSNKYKITDSTYYTKLDETTTKTRSEISNKKVDIIEVSGLKPTTEPIDFSVVCSLSFECAPNGNQQVSVTASKFAATYNIEVKEIAYTADLYTDNNRTVLVPEEGTKEIQVDSGTRATQYFYSIVNMEETDSTPGTYDIVVETSDADVLYPSGTSNGAKAASYDTTGTGTSTTNSTTNVVTPVPSKQTFYLIPAGVGTAEIKVYPVGRPEYARTYFFEINSDIKTLKLAVPQEYGNGVTSGTTFSLFSSYDNYLGQTVNAENTEKYDVYTNKGITYTSDAPEYLSVDSKGMATVLKGDAVAKKVTVTATSPSSAINGKEVSASVTITINPEVSKDPFYADLFTDKDRTVSVLNGQTVNIQAVSTNNAVQYFYNISTSGDKVAPTYDVVVETDNADVLYPSASSSGKKAASCTTTKGTIVNNATKVVTPNLSGQNFYLVPTGVGTAHIKVYPVGYPNYARTYTFVVNSDIQTITLAVPQEYKNEAAPGNSFSVFSGYKNYLGQTVSAGNMSKYSVYSNKGITYTSDAPDYVSVDATGKVTVRKADADRKSVKITATSPSSLSNGKAVTATVTITVKYPDVKANENVTDSVTGATVQVTKVSKNDLEGEAKFVSGANANAANVTIPDTVTIGGVKYKVTAVADSAFKNNSKLKTVKLGKYVTEISDNAFSGCKTLTKVTMTKEITKIGRKAFYNCKKLKTVTIPAKAKLTDIGESAFYNCKVLTKITIPVKVTTIGAKAFYNCKKLKKITVKSTVLRTVGKNAFKNIHKKAVIKVPKKKLAAYKVLLKGKGQKKTVKIKK